MRKCLSICIVLLLVLSVGMPSIIAETENEEAPAYRAIATTTVKMRREPDMNASANGSFKKDAVVEIIEYGDDWCKVQKYSAIGWVQTKYLSDVVAVTDDDGNAPVRPASALAPQNAVKKSTLTMGSFTMSEATFTENYKASTVVSCNLLKEPDLQSDRICNIDIYTELTVAENSGDWSFCRYGNHYGYIPTDSLFKWDRINPYCGDIPGLDVWDTLAFVNQSTDVFDYDTGEWLKTINPGAAIAAASDSQGRYKLGYYRQYGYVLPENVSHTIKTVPYEQAQSGDLLSVMTTYFPVGVHTLQQQGRNWNIRLSSTYITGTVLQPGQEFNMNKCIAPYLKSTGYKSAPIMSPNALTGYGGGTCQVNTTFYNATIALPLYIQHRRVHADVGIYYCKKGFDAAVGGGSINLIMENTLPYAIRYQMFVSDGVVTCCIFRA